jgi:hypothetical protein
MVEQHAAHRARRLLAVLIALVVCSVLAVETVGEPGAAADDGLVWSSSGAHRTYAPRAPESYSYAPSAVTRSGRTYYFSCHNDVSGVIADSIWFGQVVRGKIRRQQAVLAASPYGWDAHHVCDPSVVAGNFGFGGARYRYAMFYLGTDQDSTANQIGVAFATDLAGPWVRSGSPIVGIAPGAASTWGVGQPSATTVDAATGSVMLFYTDGTAGTVAYRRTLVLGDDEHWVVGEPERLTTEGLGGERLHNFDVAYDPRRDRFYVAREAGPRPPDAPRFISARIEIDSIAVDDVATGTWQVEGEITPAVTGLPRNHNPGIVRTTQGALPDSDRIDVVVSGSRTGPFPQSLYSYDLWTISGALSG